MPDGAKLNSRSQSNPDTGFGTQAARIGGRFLNKDGSFNLRKTGWSYFKRVSFYSYLLELSWPLFMAAIVACYLLINLAFTSIYLLIGTEQLQGFYSTTVWGRTKEVFYFSTQTFTTVGYGRINPTADGADLVASIESMCGWLFFAIVTGMVYGRFTRPKAFIAFSENALMSPYRGGTALMFRLVPYKNRHHLTDVRLSVNLSILVNEGTSAEYKFYSLELERSRIDMFNMNWTVVHPINEKSPLLNFTTEDLAASDMELLVQVSGFDPLFSNNVLARTSYNYGELVWGAKFSPMFHEAEDDTTTVLELDKLNVYEKVSLVTTPIPSTAIETATI